MRLKEFTVNEVLFLSQTLCDDCKRRFNELLDGMIDEFTLCPECQSIYHMVFDKDHRKRNDELHLSEEFQRAIARASECFKELEQKFTMLSMELKQFHSVSNEQDTAIQIANLESRKKHCKNYLELKQIERELNWLKWGSKKVVRNEKSL